MHTSVDDDNVVSDLDCGHILADLFYSSKGYDADHSFFRRRNLSACGGLAFSVESSRSARLSESFFGVLVSGALHLPFSGFRKWLAGRSSSPTHHILPSACRSGTL